MASKTAFRAAIAAMAALGVQGCGGFIPSGDGSDRSAYSKGSGPGSSASRQGVGLGSASGASPRGLSSAGSCLSELGATGARFSALPDRYTGPGCNQLGTVQLSALSGDIAQFEVSSLGPVKCEVAEAFAGWARFGVDRAARQILGSPLARIETMGSYSCRNIAGTDRRSSHSRAEAIDVSAFVLADGRRVSLIQDWDGGTRAEREFLRVVQSSACKRFGTVLGPEYNAAHADHFHLEGTGSKFCR